MSNLTDSKGLDRRSFLRNTAAAGAGLVLAPMVSTRAAETKKDQINIALLGAGAEGQVLMQAILKMGQKSGIRFKAVCDIWEQYNQKRVYGLLKKYRYDVNAYVDYREMLDKEKDLDAVIVATPDFWHAEHTIASLKAGLHVYCEKEMSNKLEDAAKMVQTQKETGKLLQIGHQRRSNPRYIHCYENLLNKAHILGRITHASGQWNRSVQTPNLWPKDSDISKEKLREYGFESMRQFRNWRWYKGLGGGPIVDLGSHQIDIYSWFLGTNPKSVMASGGTDYYDKDTHQWYDNVLAIYEYKTNKGLVRAFYQTITTNSNQGYFETFMGDEGTLVISESAARGQVYREVGGATAVSAKEWEKWIKLGFIAKPPEEETEEEDKDAVLDVRESPKPPMYDIPVEFNDPYHQPHLRNFFEAIRGNEELNCPAEIGYETAATVLKVNEAVEAGKTLEFEPSEFKA